MVPLARALSLGIDVARQGASFALSIGGSTGAAARPEATQDPCSKSSWGCIAPSITIAEQRMDRARLSGI
jgi:hypothetical protein